MRLFFIFFCLLCLTACDDGDILTVELDFDKELERCENFEDAHLIFDTRDDPAEALILIFPRSETNDALFNSATVVGEPEKLTINENTIRFIYRTYNRSLNTSDICAVVPPANLIISEDYEAGTGTVEVTSTFEDDDEDGVPSIFEYGPGGLADPQDSDGDGIFDYLDEDDDNDNVKTMNEIDNSDGDDDPTTNPFNTDADLPNGDDIPDYLDADDDGDGTATIAEDENQNQNPRDDNSITNGELISHYLNNQETENYGSPGIIDLSENTYNRTITTHFLVKGIDLDILRTTEIDFGILTTSLPDYSPPED